jgi:hypothetical protein
MGVSGQRYAPSALLKETDTCTLLGGPQSRSGRVGDEKNLFLLSGFEPPDHSNRSLLARLTTQLRLPLPNSLIRISSSTKILHAFLVFILALYLPP